MKKKKIYKCYIKRNGKKYSKYAILDSYFDVHEDVEEYNSLYDLHIPYREILHINLIDEGLEIFVPQFYLCSKYSDSFGDNCCREYYYFFKFTLYLEKAEKLYADLQKKIEEDLPEKKINKFFKPIKTKCYPIEGLVGINPLGKFDYSGYIYETKDGNSLSISLTEESEIQNIKVKGKRDCIYNNLQLTFNYDDIYELKKQNNKLIIYIYCNEKGVSGFLAPQVESLLTFGVCCDKKGNLFRLTITSSKIDAIYNLLLKNKSKFIVSNPKRLVEKKQKIINKKRPFIERISSNPFFFLFWIIFYPIIYIFLMPCMLLKGLFDLFRDDYRTEEEKIHDDWINTRS